MDTHNLLDAQGRALLMAHEVPDGAVVKHGHTATNGRVVKITDSVATVQIKDRGHCVVAHLAYHDGRSSRVSSPIGLEFVNESTHHARRA